jgi:hypothetical protein
MTGYVGFAIQKFAGRIILGRASPCPAADWVEVTEIET